MRPSPQDNSGKEKNKKDGKHNKEHKRWKTQQGTQKKTKN
jgi:hypothetical protein